MLNTLPNRRKFLQAAAISSGALALGSILPGTSVAQGSTAPLFDISLAEWSLNRRIFGGEMSNLDFPVFSRTPLSSQRFFSSAR